MRHKAKGEMHKKSLICSIVITMLFVAMLLMLAAIEAQGADLTFAWDPNKEPDLAGYRLYQSIEPGKYTFGGNQAAAEIPAGTETVTLENIPDGAWYWVLTAFDKQGNESGPSNEVTATVDSPPARPCLLRFLNF